MIFIRRNKFADNFRFSSCFNFRYRNSFFVIDLFSDKKFQQFILCSVEMFVRNSLHRVISFACAKRAFAKEHNKNE